jgi:PadR family transcriptional regulator PadR
MTNSFETYLENIESQMRKGTLEFLVLLIVADNEVYALDILKKLKEADMVVVEGTLYPLLSRLKREELVEYSWQESESGPPRKYYIITKKGTDDTPCYVVKKDVEKNLLYVSHIKPHSVGGDVVLLTDVSAVNEDFEIGKVYTARGRYRAPPATTDGYSYNRSCGQKIYQLEDLKKFDFCDLYIILENGNRIKLESLCEI